MNSKAEACTAQARRTLSLFFVKEDAFIQLIAEYQFLFGTSDRIDDAFDNGQFVYGVDLGLRF